MAQHSVPLTAARRPEAFPKGRSYRLRWLKEEKPAQLAHPGPSPRLAQPPGKPPLRPTPGQGPPPASPASFLWEVRLLSCPSHSRLRLAAAATPSIDWVGEGRPGSGVRDPHSRGSANRPASDSGPCPGNKPPARLLAAGEILPRHQYVLDKSCQV